MLDVDRISKAYGVPPSELRVLDGVTFSLEPGRRLAIMGPSGSGKSTLLAIIGALEPPTSGTVRLDGIDPFATDARHRAAFRNERIGFVFQDHHLLAGCTALDNVLVPAIARGTVPEAVVERAAELLARVGLADRAGHLPAELSGGERQRVAVARALLSSPRLVLADEPTGQLDSRSAAAVTELLIELTAEAGGMLVVVTHDAEVAGRMGTVRRLVDGRLDA
ncbi:MAG: Lipoprotein-releasing system ATP-binding protein LolD [Planctomycetota bacterium]